MEGGDSGHLGSAIMFTIIALILAVLATEMAWYSVATSWEWPSITYRSIDNVYYLDGYEDLISRTHGFIDNFRDYGDQGLVDLMQAEFALIGCWIIFGISFVMSCLLQLRRMQLILCVATVAASVLTVVVFMIFIAGAVESSGIGIELDGFMGTEPGNVSYDYSYGPEIGWWTAAIACAIQSMGSLMFIALGRRI